MEGREGITSGVTVIGAEAPSAYQMAPRKYGPNGSVTMALSPLPISSSAPFSNDFSTAKRGKPRGMEYKQSKKVVVDHLGYSAATKSQSACPFISMCLVEVISL